MPPYLLILGFLCSLALICVVSSIIPKIFQRIPESIAQKIVQFFIYLLLIIVGIGALCILPTIFDAIFGIDRTYHRIMAQKHPIDIVQIYNRFNVSPSSYNTTFNGIDIYLSCEVDSFSYSETDSLFHIYLQDPSFYHTLDFYNYFAFESISDSLKNFFFYQCLNKAHDKYQVLSPILTRYQASEDIDGIISVYNLLNEWHWDRTISSPDRIAYVRDSLITLSLWYGIQYLEQKRPLSDSLSRYIFHLSKQGLKCAREAFGTYSNGTIFFADKRAEFAYRIKDRRADKYADFLISSARRYPGFFSNDYYFELKDRGGNAQGYHNRFFSDPLFLRYKTCLLKKEYKKAKTILDFLSSETSDNDFDPLNPYRDIPTSLQSDFTDYDKGDLLAYAKYDLASISENARLKHLTHKKDADKWMTGSYLTGAYYLSPTEGFFGSLDEYVLDSDINFTDLTSYMSINYNNSDPRWVYNTALFIKGTSTKIQSTLLQAINNTNDSELIEEIEDIRRQYVFSPNGAIDSIARNDVKINLENHFKEGLKDVLGDCFQSFLDVKRRLAPNECAIEIIKVPSLSFQDDIYRAVVLRGEWEEPRIINLCNAKTINDLISRGRVYSYSRNNLYSIIWAPFEKWLSPRDTVYLSLDGVLSLVNIGALPNSDSSRLHDTYNIVPCVSTKDIKQDSPSSPSSIALFGGLLYDEEPQNRNTIAHYRAYRSPRNDWSNMSFSYLPGSEEEVDHIKEKAINAHIQATEYKGLNGNEEAFKNLSNSGINLIHIATHGFYYQLNISQHYTFFERLAYLDNPMNRCGLLMSGGQLAWQGLSIPDNQEDGILLGSEIARMDLSSVDLVVLSACNTGLGDISTEGVSGLLKAFKQAGVKSVLISLDKVDDEATSLLMTSFYENLFNGMSKNDAFIAAQDVLKKNDKYNSPEYWAPFVLIN